MGIFVDKVTLGQTFLQYFSFPDPFRQCRKGSGMDAWEQFFIQTMHQQGRLIQEQYANDPNPLYLLLQTQPGQQGKTQSAEQAIVQRLGKLPHSKDAGTNV
jgi:hypothetical protein